MSELLICAVVFVGVFIAGMLYGATTQWPQKVMRSRALEAARREFYR